MNTLTIIPSKECKSCHGTGTVTDFVPWGATTTAMDSFCDCVLDQVPDSEDYEIEITPDPMQAEYQKALYFVSLMPDEAGNIQWFHEETERMKAEGAS